MMTPREIYSRLKTARVTFGTAPEGAPVLHLRLSRQRPEPMYKRGITASESSRLYSSWGTVPETAHTIIKTSARALRARSRDLSLNSAYGRKFVLMCQTNIVGATGFTFQAACQDPGGGPDRPASEALEAGWKDWQRPQNCDAGGRYSFAQLCRLMIASACRDGEVLIRYQLGPDAGPYAFRLHVIDPEWLDVDYCEDLANGNYIRNGVEVDIWGRAQAYHMLALHPAPTTYNYYGRRYERIDTRSAHLAFLPELIGQLRGLPWTTTALIRMKMLEGYEEAALVAARVGASKMGAIKSEHPEGYTGTEKTTTGDILEGTEPGQWKHLPPGTSLETWDPTYPHGEFGEFVRAGLRAISAGLGVSHAGLSNDLEKVNYSSARVGVLEERELWMALQDWFVDTVLYPIYCRWLDLALLTGAVKIKGQPLRAEQREKYQRVRFVGRRWGWVDPLKDANAKIAELKYGITTLGEIHREKGKDTDDLLEEAAALKKKLEALGLEFGEPPKPGAGEAPRADAFDVVRYDETGSVFECPRSLADALLERPYPNEHAARLQDPKKYVRMRRENDWAGKGVHAIWGITGGKNSKVELQAIRFAVAQFTEAQARKWLKDHGYKPILFEPAAKQEK